VSPVVLVLVLLGVSVAAVAIEMLYDSADQPATVDDESRTKWEPWPTIWRRARARSMRAIRRTVTALALTVRVVVGGSVRVASATVRVIVHTARSTAATAVLAVTGVVASAGNLRQRRALLRTTSEIHREGELGDPTEVPAWSGATAGSGTTARGSTATTGLAIAPSPPAPSGSPSRPGGLSPGQDGEPGQPTGPRRVVSAPGRPGGVPAAPSALADSGPLVDPRRRAGVVVPLQVPTTTRIKAVVGLLLITTVVGVAVAAMIVAVALALFQALEGL
jgi:hypothetical protein